MVFVNGAYQCAQTHFEEIGVIPWWRVDLNATYRIGSVVIHTAIDEDYSFQEIRIGDTLDDASGGVLNQPLTATLPGQTYFRVSERLATTKSKSEVLYELLPLPYRALYV